MIFALWTMKELGGGELVLTDYHSPGWDLTVAESMRGLLEMQPYVERVTVVPYKYRGLIDYDLQAAEDDFNPQWFPEWNGKWPGNVNILRRYAIHFGFCRESLKVIPWMVAPCTKGRGNVVAHVPMRRSLRLREDWRRILTAVDAVVLGKEDITGLDCSWLETADWINSSKVFLGTVSSCNAIAEALGKVRFVEQAEDCFNVNPTVSINGMDNEEVVRRVLEVVNGHCGVD